MKHTNVRSLAGRSSTLATTTVVLSALGILCGCVATKYKLAKKDTPPVQILSIPFPATMPLQATLASLITYGGPGSWKRTALWDEYVVELVNHSDQPLTIDSATLLDSTGAPHAAGNDPWVLEKQSKDLERQYRSRGEAFLRAAGPGVVIVGVGAAAGAAGGGVFLSTAAAGAFAAAATAIVVLPVYYVSVLGINHHNKKAVMKEFNRRRLALPLTLAPGEARAGSLFFPMVRSPSSLALHAANDSATATATLPLGFLNALHLPAAPAGSTTK